MSRNFCVFACLGIAALVLGGCSKRTPIEETRTKVTGKVTFDGQPLRGGAITFVSSTDPQLRVSAMIQEDGTFAVDDAPRGDVKIAVDTETLRFGAPAHQYIQIPAHYAKPDESKLTGTIAPDSPPMEIKLVK